MSRVFTNSQRQGIDADRVKIGKISFKSKNPGPKDQVFKDEIK
jgi:hypothetical protein